MLNTVFFYVGIFFSLCGGQEQRDLIWENFRRVPADNQVYNSETYYVYTEFVSKNNQHRFRDTHMKNKAVKSYAVCESERCLVRILDFFKSKIPGDPKAFYLRPLEKTRSDPDKPWFSNIPVGINTLNRIVHKLFDGVDCEQTYTNHSLRATSASRLFAKGVPEKIVAERTGHRSLTSLRAYERTTDKQCQSATTVLVSDTSTFSGSANCPKSDAMSDPEKDKLFQGISGTFHGCTFNF